MSASNDYLFIAGICIDRDKTISSVPTDYTNENTQAGTGANTATCSTAERALTTGSAEDPSAFSSSGVDQWVATTVKVFPSGGGPSPSTLRKSRLMTMGLS